MEQNAPATAQLSVVVRASLMVHGQHVQFAILHTCHIICKEPLACSAACLLHCMQVSLAYLSWQCYSMSLTAYPPVVQAILRHDIGLVLHIMQIQHHP